MTKKLLLLSGVLFVIFPLFGQTANRVLLVGSFPGSTADQEIRECLAALPGGGTCDARGLGASTQNLSSTITIGTGNDSVPVTLLLDPSTSFVPPDQSTTLFAVQAGGSIVGATCNTTGVTGWNAACVATSGTIGQAGPTATHISNITCIGEVNGGGHCIDFSPSSGSSSATEVKVMFVHVSDVEVHGMEAGIYLSAIQTGPYVWVNGNWFDDVLCVSTLNCVQVQVDGTATTTQVSENSFSNLKAEARNAQLTAISINVANSGTSEFNNFNGITAFDFAPGSVVVNLSSHTQKNQVAGFLCFAVCGGVTYADKGNGNVIKDWWNEQSVNTAIEILAADATKEGALTAGSSGPQLLLDGTSDFKIWGGNGGLRVVPGKGSDHNLYVQSLDPASGQIVFNKPISATGAFLGNAFIGSASTYLPIYDPSGNRQGYLIYGAHGPEFDLDPSHDLRVYGGNGGLKVIPGSGQDHNLYLQNMDNTGGSTVFNTPLAAGGGSSNKVVCWKSDGVTLGHCSTQPNSSGGCTCN